MDHEMSSAIEAGLAEVDRAFLVHGALNEREAAYVFTQVLERQGFKVVRAAKEAQVGEGK